MYFVRFIIARGGPHDVLRGGFGLKLRHSLPEESKTSFEGISLDLNFMAVQPWGFAGSQVTT